MDLREFQSMTVALATVAWPDEMRDPGRMDAELRDKLSEEVGELAKVCRRHGGHRTHWRGAAQVSDDQVLDEVGDVLFVLARRAALHGVDLAAAGDRAIAKFVERLKAMGKQPTMNQLVDAAYPQDDQAAAYACTGNGKPTCTCPACTLADQAEAYDREHKSRLVKFLVCGECGFFRVPGMPCPKCGHVESDQAGAPSERS